MHQQDRQRSSDTGSGQTFAEVLEARLGRRGLMIGGLASAVAGVFASPFGSGIAGAGPVGRIAGAAGQAAGDPLTAAAEAPLLGFASVPNTGLDTVVVPPGYRATPAFPWGTPIDGTVPAFRPDAGNSAQEQLLQFGMHHDGMHFFPIGGRSDEGLLVVNHEYTDDGLLHPGGMVPWTSEKVFKSQAAHGVTVAHVKRTDGAWKLVSSPHSRRVTAFTPMHLAGPAAGHALLRTAVDPSGTRVFGTLNNCANGVTPWNTYLTCEENWNGYFANPAGDALALAEPAKGVVLAAQKRYGVGKEDAGYRWFEHDDRFDASKHPNEPHRFGWVVEIDPFDPHATPVKRTALGRFKHEGAFATEAADGRVVVYSGDDERFEYIYKFVSAEPWRQSRHAGRSPLDEGTLYVARFGADGTGVWLPLVWGKGPLVASKGFADQGDVLIRARQAADALGATKMDRPEWIARHPDTGDVYCTLTNNTQRGTEGRAPIDGPNPRATNSFGHIIRWREMDGDAASTAFDWDIFVLAGDPAQADEAKRGNIDGDTFGSPDGLWFDPAGRLWIQTDISTSSLGKGDYAYISNNMMLAADPASGKIKRFLVGPRGCEITGVTMTPDARTMFVNVQHPGEGASDRSDPAAPTAVSSWPDGAGSSRPRSATVIIERIDGGVIGA